VQKDIVAITGRKACFFHFLLKLISIQLVHGIEVMTGIEFAGTVGGL